MLLECWALRAAKSLPFVTRVESVHDLEHGQRTSDNRERIENSHQADLLPTERLVYTGVSNGTARSMMDLLPRMEACHICSSTITGYSYSPALSTDRHRQGGFFDYRTM